MNKYSNIHRLVMHYFSEGTGDFDGIDPISVESAIEHAEKRNPNMQEFDSWLGSETEGNVRFDRAAAYMDALYDCEIDHGAGNAQNQKHDLRLCGGTPFFKICVDLVLAHED